MAGDPPNELTAFPVSKYDEHVDSASRALEWIKIGTTDTGPLDFYRHESARLRWEIKPPSAA